MRVGAEGGMRSRDITNDMIIRCQLIQDACSSYEFCSLLTPAWCLDVSARCCLPNLWGFFYLSGERKVDARGIKSIESSRPILPNKLKSLFDPFIL